MTRLKNEIKKTLKAKITIKSKSNKNNYDNNEWRKRWVFSLALKILTVLALLMSNGNAFHSFGAAQVKERSPSVALDLKRG